MDIKSLFANNPELDTKSADFLSNALTTNSQQGFDYIKFKTSLKALKQMNQDDYTAIHSAFATASTLGITKDKLLQSAMHYKNVLNKEKDQFDLALQKQMTQRVASKQDEAVYLQEKIKEYELKIQELRKQIEDFQYKINNADKEIEAAKEKIESTKDRFESTFNSFVGEIDKDIQLIQQAL
ncbi:MAG: hypothetical protein AAGK97_00305 [Bacteroidota bacterium]